MSETADIQTPSLIEGMSFATYLGDPAPLAVAHFEPCARPTPNRPA